MSQLGDKHTTEQLRTAAEDGDYDAFLAYSVRSLPSLYRYMEFQCSKSDISVDLANDFCHDAIIKASEDLKAKISNRKDISISLQWLKTIAYRLMLDHLRRNGRWISNEDIVSDYYTESEEDSDSLEEVAKFFEWLTPAEQEIIEQVIVKKRDLPEAAAEMEITVEAAKKRLYRAICHLRDFVNEHGSVAVET